MKSAVAPPSPVEVTRDGESDEDWRGKLVSAQAELPREAVAQRQAVAVSSEKVSEIMNLSYSVFKSFEDNAGQ